MTDPSGWIGRTILVALLLSVLFPPVSTRAASSQVGPGRSGSLPLDVTADRIDYRQDQEVYEADGSVVIQQGQIRLTADHATIDVLPGILTATGHVHLTDPQADITTDRLELNVNTEAGVVTHGKLYVPASNSSVSGRLIQRFSEYHYRVKEGSFTNCDAQEGHVPAWRLRFDDLDLMMKESLAFKGAWLCVNDVPTIPLPTLSYPLSTRQSGLLMPFVGYDNRFGLHYQQGLYWAINPSQDLTVSPSYYSNLGYGSDLEYRYVLDRFSRGQWFVSFLQQTQLPNVSGVSEDEAARRARGSLSGSHTQYVNGTLLIRSNINLVTDPSYYQQLSNVGTQRALPSNESNFLTTQRLPYGNLYFLGQYLQPLQAGSTDTFQRLPETGYSLPDVSIMGSPFRFGMEGNFVNFYREQGFTVNRVEAVPSLSTDMIDFGHVVGITPQAKWRDVYYTRGIQSNESEHRQTYWLGIDATSQLSRRFGLDNGDSVLHTLEPSVMYEYVPSTDQARIPVIDEVDNLPKKNLLTYMLRSRVLEQGPESVFSWLDLTLAQSYRVDGVQTRARDFTPGAVPMFGSFTQPLQPATVDIQGRKFSDVWMRAIIGNTTPQYTQAQLATQAFGRAGSPMAWLRPKMHEYVVFDAFVDPYRGQLSQFNTDFRVQEATNWYVEVGQRYTREGIRPRRGDIWNPISFNEVFAPTEEIQFVTAGGGFRTPWGWTLGAKGYYDVKNNRSPEYDIVALYQNPCKCWSLGLFYLQFPDRAQYNFMLTLTGLGWTENFGTAVIRSILSPLLWNERGLPWASPGGPYGLPYQGLTPGMVRGLDR